MYEELIKALNCHEMNPEVCVKCGFYNTGFEICLESTIMADAADAIETLTAENATLRAQLDELKEAVEAAANSNDHAERRIALKILRSVYPSWPLPSAPEQEDTQ